MKRFLATCLVFSFVGMIMFVGFVNVQNSNAQAERERDERLQAVELDISKEDLLYLKETAARARKNAVYKEQARDRMVEGLKRQIDAHQEKIEAAHKEGNEKVAKQLVQQHAHLKQQLQVLLDGMKNAAARKARAQAEQQREADGPEVRRNQLAISVERGKKSLAQLDRLIQDALVKPDSEVLLAGLRREREVAKESLGKLMARLALADSARREHREREADEQLANKRKLLELDIDRHTKLLKELHAKQREIDDRAGEEAEEMQKKLSVAKKKLSLELDKLFAMQKELSGKSRREHHHEEHEHDHEHHHPEMPPEARREMRKVESLWHASKVLKEGGLHEEAAHMAERAEHLKREIMEHVERRHHEREEHGHNPQLAEIIEILRDLKEEVSEIREEVDEIADLLEGDDDDEEEEDEDRRYDDEDDEEEEVSGFERDDDDDDEEGGESGDEDDREED